uniref:Uncharacterized protein n=2 Tax=Picea TaxID=3328 RepID=A0A101M3N1_PICGL|nr:hypothetical protein ABT39_MTgene135 [Picea glauca]KUM50305.1 hypothetical protein ABT39_MTgene148 [Picea glauca]KUM50316.1 hypothetical protein ABT39_MTgene159 [Picea glauca]QHR91782.1 hypothetical protein Q903MT_gene5818 [Picea sitchensis]
MKAGGKISLLAPGNQLYGNRYPFAMRYVSLAITIAIAMRIDINRYCNNTILT